MISKDEDVSKLRARGLGQLAVEIGQVPPDKFWAIVAIGTRSDVVWSALVKQR